MAEVTLVDQPLAMFPDQCRDLPGLILREFCNQRCGAGFIEGGNELSRPFRPLHQFIFNG